MARQNYEAERHLLGAVLQDNTILRELRIKPEHFYDIKHQSIYNAMKQIDARSEAIDAVSIYTELETLASVDELSNIQQSVPSIESYRQYEKYIIEAWKERKAEEQVKDFMDGGKVTDLVTSLSEIESSYTDEEDFDLKELLVEMYQDAETSTGEMNGIPTGYTELDNMTDGNQGGQLIIVAARPSMGKTAYALNIATGHMENGAFGHIYSLEMGRKSLMKRMISAEAKIDSMKMRQPRQRFSDFDWEKYTNAIGKINEYAMYISDKSSITVPEIYANTRKIMRKNPDKKHFVVIDYLQLMKGTKRAENRVQEVSEISRNLKIMALDLDIPVIALSQLSRGVESRQDKRPMLSDLRESGSIEQDADRVELLYRDDYYNGASEIQNIIEIIIAKQREGPVGTTELAFIKEYNKFLNLDRRYDSGNG